MAAEPGRFEKRVMKSPDLWVVCFYAGWDDASGKFMAEFHKASVELKGVAKLVKVKALASLEKRFKVKKYPAIRILNAGLENKKSKKAITYEVVGDGEDMAKVAKIVNELVESNKKKSDL